MSVSDAGRGHRMIIGDRLYLRIESLQILEQSGEAEFFSHTLFASLAHRLGFCRFFKHTYQGVGERVGVFRRYQQSRAALANDFRNATNAGCDHGQAGSHIFEHCIW